MYQARVGEISIVRQADVIENQPAGLGDAALRVQSAARAIEAGKVFDGKHRWDVGKAFGGGA
jgi:hypothetical protein